MAFIDRMKGQDYIDATRKYLDYVEEHLDFVRLAFDELSRACEGMWWVGDDYSWHMLREEVEAHDLSKFSRYEFVQYRDHFYPVCERDKLQSGMAEAWEHHKLANHHHHETVETYRDMIHMVIDWTAMGYKFGDTAQSYYEKNKKKIKIKDEFKRDMYEIFERIAKYRVKNPPPSSSKNSNAFAGA